MNKENDYLGIDYDYSSDDRLDEILEAYGYGSELSVCDEPDDELNKIDFSKIDLYEDPF